MDFLKVLPGSRREPPGLERTVLRKLPVVALGGTLVPLFFAIASRVFPPAGGEVELARHLGFVDAFAVAAAVTLWTAVFTVAIGAFVVRVMKGPAYVADRYDLHDPDRPG
jgi:hypothetical protein